MLHLVQQRWDWARCSLVQPLLAILNVTAAKDQYANRDIALQWYLSAACILPLNGLLNGLEGLEHVLKQNLSSVQHIMGGTRCSGVAAQ